MADELAGYVTIQFDSQIFSQFLSCPRAMDFRFNRHLVPVSGSSKSIGKGSLFHLAMHKFNQARIEAKSYSDCKAIAMKTARESAPTVDKLEPDDALLVYKTLEEYLDYSQNFNTMIPLAAERHFAIEVHRDEALKLRVVITGRIDLIESPINSNQLVPSDYKTESESWFYSALSNQFKFYAIACQSDKVLVRRVGFQKTKKPEDKYKIETLNFDPDTLAEFQNEIIPYYAKQLLVCMEENYYPPNYSSCIKGHFGCIFSDKYNSGGICTVSPKMREQKLGNYFVQGIEWSPENDV